MANGLTIKDQEIKLIKILYPHLNKTSDLEIQKGIALAKYLGLDPLKKEVHFVPYGQSVQLIVSYTEYIKRAERSGKLDGWQVKIEGERENLRAVVTIYRKDWSKPFEWTVFLKEVVKNTPVWEQMPLFMLRKVAISQAFRICFPEETGFLPYEEAELSPEGEVSISPEQIKINPQPQSEPQALPEAPKWDMTRIKEVATEELKEAVRLYGATSKMLIELFNEFNGDQKKIIERLKEISEEKKKKKEGGKHE